MLWVGKAAGEWTRWMRLQMRLQNPARVPRRGLRALLQRRRGHGYLIGIRLERRWLLLLAPAPITAYVAATYWTVTSDDGCTAPTTYSDAAQGSACAVTDSGQVLLDGHPNDGNLEYCAVDVSSEISIPSNDSDGGESEGDDMSSSADGDSGSTVRWMCHLRSPSPPAMAGTAREMSCRPVLTVTVRGRMCRRIPAGATTAPAAATVATIAATMMDTSSTARTWWIPRWGPRAQGCGCVVGDFHLLHVLETVNKTTCGIALDAENFVYLKASFYILL